MRNTRMWSMTKSILLMCGVCFSFAVFAEEAVELAEEEGSAEAEKAPGILPIPDYGGDFRTRSYLTSDWGGTRAKLADKGIQFNAEVSQYGQAVVDGGFDSSAKWGGRAAYMLHLDLQKMDLIPGGLVYVRFDSRWGRSANGLTGQFLPANQDFLIPVDSEDLDRETWGTLTALNYTQFLSPKFGVFLGKLDLMDSDPNEFAGGRGATQFMNYSLMFAAPTAILPASTIGAGVMFIPNENVTIASQLFSATDSSFDPFSEAFDDWDDGQIWANTLMTQYRLRDLPGGFNATYLRWYNSDFRDLGSIVAPPGGLTSTKDRSWLVALSAWQYLYTEGSSTGPLNAANKIPDLQGWGLFSRIGFADKDTNPFKFNVSIGIGGRGVLHGRDNDIFGVGYFYTETESGNIITAIGIDDSTQGAEVFYNLAITPAAMLAFDVQWLQAIVPGVDNAIVLGTRFRLVF